MARNNDIVTGVVDQYDYGILPDGTLELFYVGHPGTMRTDTIRADSSPTPPTANGKYYLPTEYWAQFCRLKTNQFSYKLNSTAPYHPYDKHLKTGESASGFWPLPWVSYGCVPTRPHTPEILQWIIEGCESDALQKMKSQDFNAGVFLAELPETVGFIAKLFEALGATFISLLGKHPSIRTGNPTKAAADAWLGWQLGAKPLIDDIYGAATLCIEGFHVPLFAVVETTRVDHDFPPQFTPPGGFFGWYWWFHHYRDRSVCKRGVTVSIAWRVLNPTLYALDSFGILNPTSLIWEAMSYSFVVDYFLGVGNFLQAMSAPIGVEFVHGYRTKWLKNNYDVEYVPKDYNTIDYSGGTYPRITGSLKCMKRDVYNDFPAVLPALRLPVSLTKALNMVGLIAQAK